MNGAASGTASIAVDSATVTMRTAKTFSTAAGDARNLMSARAASGCFAPTATPAENTVTF